MNPQTPFQLSNEFAEVSLRVVTRGNGERLEITSQRRGTSIQLDPVELEALTWQTTATFTKMLESSIGPAEITETHQALQHKIGTKNGNG
jgi:hypothetical protein